MRRPGTPTTDCPPPPVAGAPAAGPPAAEPAPPAERSLPAYLLLPRPGEAWVKGWLAAIAFGVVALAGDEPPGPPLAVALAAWTVFELVLYQVRYLLNDLADAEVDRDHVAAGTRGRLPGGEPARRWARISVAPRLAVGLVCVAALPPPARETTAMATLGLAGATVAYEAARTGVRRRRVAIDHARLRGADAAVFGLVGAGYALRLGLGAALAGATGGLVAATAVFGWAFGTLVVVMTWTCEAAGLLSGGGGGVLARKSHVALLARLVGDDPRRWCTPLLAGPPARLVGGLEAGTVAAALVTGGLLDGRPTAMGLTVLVLVCVVAAPVLVAIVPRPAAGWAAAALAVAACLGAAGGDGVGTAVVVFCVAGPVAAFRTFSPASLGLAPARSTGGAPAGRGPA